MLAASVTNMPWTIAVVFIAMIAVLLAFAANAATAVGQHRRAEQIG